MMHKSGFFEDRITGECFFCRQMSRVRGVPSGIAASRYVLVCESCESVAEESRRAEKRHEHEKANAAEATRHDKGKPRWDLLPFRSLEQLVLVYTFGASKYADNNWRKGMAWSRCFASCLRHMYAWKMGEKNDPESNLPHLAHAIWNLITLLEYQECGLGTDDRNIDNDIPR